MFDIEYTMIDRIRRRGRKCLQTTKEEEEEEEEVVTSSVLSAARISISSHQRKIETMLLGEPSTPPSFDNCIPNSESSEDDTSSLVEDELMGLYDTCQNLAVMGVEEDYLQVLLVILLNIIYPQEKSIPIHVRIPTLMCHLLLQRSGHNDRYCYVQVLNQT